MPIDLLRKPPIFTAGRTDREIARDIGRHCSSLQEIVVTTLLVLDWKYDVEEDVLVKPANEAAISKLALEYADERHLIPMLFDMGSEREARIAWMAHDELPTYLRIANAMAGRR